MQWSDECEQEAGSVFYATFSISSFCFDIFRFEQSVLRPTRDSTNDRTSGRHVIMRTTLPLNVAAVRRADLVWLWRCADSKRTFKTTMFPFHVEKNIWIKTMNEWMKKCASCFSGSVCNLTMAHAPFDFFVNSSVAMVGFIQISLNSGRSPISGDAKAQISTSWWLVKIGVSLSMRDVHSPLGGVTKSLWWFRWWVDYNEIYTWRISKDD